MHIIRSSDIKIAIGKDQTVTFILDDNTVLRVSPLEILSIVSKLIEMQCNALHIPASLIEKVKANLTIDENGTNPIFSMQRKDLTIGDDSITIPTNTIDGGAKHLEPLISIVAEWMADGGTNNLSLKEIQNIVPDFAETDIETMQSELSKLKIKVVKVDKNFVFSSS